MPTHSILSSERCTSILNYLSVATSTLNELYDALGTPFLKAISQMTVSLVDKVESVKRHKDDCLTMMEQIHQILYAIIRLHITSNTGGVLPPVTLENMGKFTETLQKIHVFVEAQDGNRIKHFFRLGERNSLLKQCQEGLEEALVLFRVQTGSIATEAAEMHQTAHQTHETLLELVSSLSDETGSTRTSITIESLFSFGNSSTSLDMLPPKPAIFHGRDAQLEQIVNALDQPSPRIAILGAGGMGKTSLARAVLHHSTVLAKYPSRIFALCDSTRTGTELVSQIASHLGLKLGKNPAQSVVQYFSRAPSCLLFLDNLETCWEPLASRTEVEDFLALLAAVPHIGLIITMRGAERPAKVAWTRPFLQPLQSLTNEAAQKIFIDIADSVHNYQDTNQLLSLTDNMPLVVTLVAHVVASEGYKAFLARWQNEKTSMLYAGFDKKSNLDMSISLSLSSPRMISSQGATELLSILSILPDGISDTDLLQSNLPIPDILTCKATLLRTSLAYADQNQRLRVLAPIREYMEHIWPPGPLLVRPLRKHFQELVELCTRYYGLVVGGATVIQRVTSNIGNLQNILLRGLDDSAYPDLRDIVQCCLSLNILSRTTAHGCPTLMARIPAILATIEDHRLQAEFIHQVFSSWLYNQNFWIGDPESLIDEAREHFSKINDQSLEAQFYMKVGDYFRLHNSDIDTAMLYFKTARSLARAAGNTHWQGTALTRMALAQWQRGDFSVAVATAREAQRLIKSSGNLMDEAGALRVMAISLSASGQYQLSILVSRQARELLALCGLSNGEQDLMLINSEAEIHFLKTEYLEAQEAHALILRSTSFAHSPNTCSYALLNLALIGVRVGARQSDVLQNLNKAKSMFTAIGYSRGVTFCELCTGDLCLREGDATTARHLFEKCFKSSDGKNSEITISCLEKLADISCWSQKDINATSSWATVFLAYSVKSRGKREIYQAIYCLGNLFLNNGDKETAEHLLTVSLQGFTHLDVHQSRAECMLRLGDISTQRSWQMAVNFWETARPLFERSSQINQIEQIDKRLAGASETLSQQQLAPAADRSAGDRKSQI